MSRTCPMSVENTGFLLDRLGQDCHPLQFLRELTQNSIEAILRTGRNGEIIWEPDAFFLSQGMNKLSIVDNGDGMTSSELMSFINKLSSSSSKQSMDGNYGVGAKITAAVNNPIGVIYQSWKNDDSGSMIHLWKDQDNDVYGLKQFAVRGKHTHVVAPNEAFRPKITKPSGTKVTLLGKSLDQDTMSSQDKKQWIIRYLNERFFKIPDTVSLKVYDASSKGHRTIKGMNNYLSKESEKSGSVMLSQAIVHWWILKPTNDRSWASNIETGHVAALYKNELYDMKTGRSRNTIMQDYGIIFEIHRVVLYIEPTCDVSTNTARTMLLLKGEQLPWSEWGAEFIRNIPHELVELQEESISRAKGQDKSDIIKRLALIQNLLKVSGYKRNDQGKKKAIGDTQSSNSDPISPGTTGKKESKSSESNKRLEDMLNKLQQENEDGVPAEEDTQVAYPKVFWVSTEDNNRVSGEIEDRAASYTVSTNTLKINMDFRGYKDIIKHLLGDREDVKIALPVVTNAVKSWYEQAMVEPIISLQSIKGSEYWTEEDIKTALSEEALTMAAMQRYHIVVAAKRQIGAQLGAQK